MSTAKRALVLGCGGVAGGAWSIATLQRIEQQLGWDARDADIIIGTSVGAVLAALLGADVSVDKLAACQRGEGDCHWNHDVDSGGAFPPLPKPRFTAPDLLLKGLRGKVPILAAVSGLMPQGSFDMTPFRQLIDDVVPAGEWAPRDGLWIMTVDTRSGQRVAFGRDDAPAAALNDAVCASYGVPAWCPPVVIGDRRYIDGGVASPTSADFLLDADIDEVIVLAPMASQRPDRPDARLARIERGVRRYMTRIVDREVTALEATGKRVRRYDPGPADLRAIGYNMMDPKRRLKVFETALKTN